MHFEQPLDDEQRLAVTAEERAVAVLAGPGSGKTRVLSFRTRYLLSRDKTSNALLLTFTNKAASEMKSRAIAVTPVMSKRIRAGTFHNFALAVLRAHGSHVGISGDFDVLDDEERTAIANELAVTLGSPNHARAWSEQRLRQRLATSDVAKFGALFEEAKRKNEVVDFDDLIVYVAQLFRQKPDIAKAYAAKFRHILIDEFQDTNAAQFAIVRALAEHASPDSTISVFADDDQAIFGFAGAESQNIVRFTDDLQAKVYPLTTNYRCCAEIVACANRLIQANRSQGRQMKAAKGKGDVTARLFRTTDDEGHAVCDHIQNRLANGVPAHHISVLVRSAYRAKSLQSLLASRGIPYSNWLAATYNSREQRQIRVCLAVLRPMLTKRVRTTLCELLKLDDGPDTSPVGTEQFLNLHKALPAVQHLLAVKKLAESKARVSEIVREVGKCIEALDPAASVADTLAAETAAFESHDPEYSLDHLLADLALGGKGGAPTEGGGVKLASIHRTKGLQWPHVYLIGLEADSLPSFQTKTDEQLREERRLCFVGVCRAEDSLTLTRIENYSGHAKHPSPFLRELGLTESSG